MSDETRRLDGNAAAGLLAEIFPFEITSAQTTCATCGWTGRIGALLLYGGEMGAILRCPTCDTAHLRVAHLQDRYYVDMRGMKMLQISGERAPA